MRSGTQQGVEYGKDKLVTNLRKRETVTVHSIDRASWLTKLERISVLSARNRRMVFNNIGHLINAGMLKEQYLQLDGKKTIGINRVTKISYGKNLDNNIAELR